MNRKVGKRKVFYFIFCFFFVLIYIFCILFLKCEEVKSNESVQETVKWKDMQEMMTKEKLESKQVKGKFLYGILDKDELVEHISSIWLECNSCLCGRIPRRKNKNNGPNPWILSFVPYQTFGLSPICMLIWVISHVKKICCCNPRNHCACILIYIRVVFKFTTLFLFLAKLSQLYS